MTKNNNKWKKILLSVSMYKKKKTKRDGKIHEKGSDNS